MYRTTGVSKLVQRTHNGLVGSIEQKLHWFNFRLQSKEVMYSGLKFCGMGYIVSGLLAPLKGRFKAVVLPKYGTQCPPPREQVSTNSIDVGQICHPRVG